MTALQLQHRTSERHLGGAPDAGAPAADLSSVREAGHRAIDQGFDAVERALSADSEAFLAASRQRGGQ